MDRFDRKNIKYYILVICVLAVIALLMMAGLYKCPLRLLLGIPCPLCGMTRAIVSALGGNFAAAFYYHPLWPAAVILILLYILVFTHVLRPSKTVIGAVLILSGVMLAVCFVWRHIAGSEVVRVDFASSLLYRLVHNHI